MGGLRGAPLVTNQRRVVDTKLLCKRGLGQVLLLAELAEPLSKTIGRVF